jgi:glycosyltransferase involved in cell wall biosynthesis
MSSKRILCFASYYLPGFKSGGPVRSISNMCDWLCNKYEFWIVTRNRDSGDAVPYANRPTGRWSPERGAMVWYLDKPYESPRAIRRAVAEAAPDLVYFHSFFDPALTIAPFIMHRLGLLKSNAPVVIAPRGELSAEALQLKPKRKEIYLGLTKRLKLCDGVTWHATSDPELAAIRDWAGTNASIALAPNLPPRILPSALANKASKSKGELRLAFLSRICEKKNLEGALRMLMKVKAPVHLDIYGTQEDRAYWDLCDGIIRQLPGNISARYRGVVRPEDVISTLSGYHALYFPTFGENFGHVILEALLAGCPVLLSDQTPWRDLASRHAGFDLPLNAPDRFRQTIEKFAEMPSREFAAWSTGAHALGIDYCSRGDLVSATVDMFEAALTKVDVRTRVAPVR